MYKLDKVNSKSLCQFASLTNVPSTKYSLQLRKYDVIFPVTLMLDFFQLLLFSPLRFCCIGHIVFDRYAAVFKFSVDESLIYKCSSE